MKTIKKSIVLMFTLALCIGCFVGSNIMASAGSCSHQGNTYSRSQGDGHSTAGHDGTPHLYTVYTTRYCALCHAELGTTSKQMWCTCGGTPSGGGTGSGGGTTHTHSYGAVSWGSWTRVDDNNHRRTGTQTCTSTRGTCSAKTKTSTETKEHKWQAAPIPTAQELLTGAEEVYREKSATQCERKYICPDCGAVKWVAENHSWSMYSDFAALNATQHFRDRVCDKCGKVEAPSTAPHVWTSQMVKGEDGHRTIRTCTVCGYIDTSAKLTTHTWGTPSVTTSNGVQTTVKTCTVCDYQSHNVVLVDRPNGSEHATVLSDPMTLEQIKTNAKTGVSTPSWKVAIGVNSDFDVSKCGQPNYVWNYAGTAFTLSKRADGLYYVTMLPSYYYSRIRATNPNSYNGGRPSGSSGSYSSGSVTSDHDSTREKNQMLQESWRPGSQNLSDGTQAVLNIMKDAGKNGNADSSAVKPGQTTTVNGQTYSVKTSNPDTSKGEFVHHGVVYDKNGYPVVQSTQEETVYVHYCSWSTSYQDLNATQHTVIRVSCCSGPNYSQAPHSYGGWTYTDLGPELHRGERVCKQCGHIDTKIESHADSNNDTKCDQCTRVLWTIITWRWYDEHTPVTDSWSTQKAG